MLSESERESLAGAVESGIEYEAERGLFARVEAILAARETALRDSIAREIEALRSQAAARGRAGGPTPAAKRARVKARALSEAIEVARGASNA